MSRFALPKIPGSINGEEYPIALDESGNLQWQTVQVAQERDEVWEDWSLGLGETKRETGRGYLFSRGFDASTRGALRLSPFFHALNNTALTTDYGYPMEGKETSGSTLNLDAFSTTSGNVAALGDLTWNHTVANQSERILLVAMSHPNVGTTATVFYGGERFSSAAFAFQSGGPSVNIYFLLNPAVGTNTITLTNNLSVAEDYVVGAWSLFGVDVDTPFGDVEGASGTDSTPTVTATTASGEFIVAVVALPSSDSMTAGTNETERWDAAVSTTITGAGFTQAGSDGGIMAPSIDGAETDWAMTAIPVKPATTFSRSLVWVGDTTKLFRYIYDPDTGLTLSGTQTITSGVCGRPEKVNTKWYAPMATGTNARRLDDESSDTGWVDAGWKADHLRNYQQGITPTVVRVNSTTQNQVDFNADTGNVGDNWSGGQKAGDSTTDITDLVEAQGQLFVCKTDNIYEFGVEAESRPVIPFLDRGKAVPDNGKGSFAFGDEIVYMSKGDLWRYRIGRGALPIGLNTIRSWREIDDIINTPKTGRPTYGVYAGEYWYYLQNDGEESHLIQARKRREGDPEGHELIQHSVLTIPLSKGLGVDSLLRLWIKGASASLLDRDMRVIVLGPDGSLDVQNRRGQSDTDHIIYFDERNPGRPQDKVQIRHMTVETEGDWNAQTSLQLALYRDDATSPTNIGSAITTAGVHVRNPTVGTTDTAFRFRPRLTLTTGTAYTPKVSDPQILRVIVGIRFPEIIRIVINAEQMALDKTGLEAFEAEQNLRRLQNQGTVTFRRPGDYDDPASGTDLVTDRTFTGEVEGVTDIMYKTEKGYAHGLELRVKRWVTY